MNKDQIKEGRSYKGPRGLIYTVEEIKAINGRKTVRFTRHEPESGVGRWDIIVFAQMMIEEVKR